MDDQAIRNRIVYTLVRKGVVGSHKKQIDTVVNQCLPTHDRGRGRELLEEMLADPNAPVEGYGGGHRQNVRFTGIEDAVAYLEANDGDVPFGYR